MKKCLILLLVMLGAISVFAQDEEKSTKGFQKDKLFLGGNFGLTFGENTFINVSPQLGYRFNRHFAAGFGINGQYISQKQRYSNGDLYLKTSEGIVGLNLFGRFYPIDYLFVHVQPEENYRFGKVRYYDNITPSTTKVDAILVPSLLVGGGVALPTGRSALTLSLLYDVVKDPNSPYGTKPYFGIGYNIGL